MHRRDPADRDRQANHWVISLAKQKFLAALGGEPQSVPPIWIMRQAGRYLPEYREIRQTAASFLDFCYSPDLAVEATMQPIRRYGFDAAILFSDILVVPDAMGQEVGFETGRGPVLVPVGDRAGIAGLDPARTVDYLAPVYETVGRLRADLPTEVSLIGFAGAPWTVATYMVEGGTSRTFENVKSLAFGDPDLFDDLIERLIEATTAHLNAQIEAGVDAVQLFDTWAGALPENELKRWSLNPIRRIAAALKAAHPEVPVIAFPRGAGVAYAAFAACPEIDALSLDHSITRDWAAKHLQPHAALQGNLDPIRVVAGGEGMLQEADAIVDAFSAGGHVFNLAHGVIPQTPPEHVAALVDHIRSRGS